jgi:hypothetical protein
LRVKLRVGRGLGEARLGEDLVELRIAKRNRLVSVIMRRILREPDRELLPFVRIRIAQA